MVLYLGDFLRRNFYHFKTALYRYHHSLARDSFRGICYSANAEVGNGEPVAFGQPITQEEVHKMEGGVTKGAEVGFAVLAKEGAK